jgi:hypothetical protein
MNVSNKSWFCGNSPTRTLTQEEEGAASGELNQIGVQQDLDQSPEEPKACVRVESEEGKHRFHLTHFVN